MAKCVRCGRGGMGLIHSAIKLNDGNMICSKCYKELGYSPLADMTTASRLKSWNDIKDGKEAEEARRREIMAEAQRRTEAYRKAFFNVVGVRYKNDADEDIQRLLKSILKEYTADDYEGLTNKQIVEECDEDDRVYQYEIQQLDSELEMTTYEGEPAIKVYALEPERTHIGWIARDDIKKVSSLVGAHKCSATVQISGGPYKLVVWDDDDEKMTVQKETSEYYAKVILAYSV